MALFCQVERATEVEINTGPAKPPQQEKEEVGTCIMLFWKLFGHEEFAHPWKMLFKPLPLSARPSSSNAPSLIALQFQTFSFAPEAIPVHLIADTTCSRSGHLLLRASGSQTRAHSLSFCCNLVCMSGHFGGDLPVHPPSCSLLHGCSAKMVMIRLACLSCRRSSSDLVCMLVMQEEYDPLDAFMVEIDTEMKEQPSKPASKAAPDASNRGLDEEYDALEYMEVG